MSRVEIAHIGPQKSGTTWLYRCLLEHPQVACPPKDSVHYFDMFYHLGRDFLTEQFAEATPDQKWFDPTPSYLRSSWVPRRLADENPDMKIVLCLRNPMERAFSHYWHEKKKLRFEFSFEEVFKNYDLYSSWLETGFYAESIERLLEHFPEKQILWQNFDQLRANPQAFLAEFCRFVEVDAAFRPSVLDKKVNAAGEKHDFLSSRVQPKIKGAIKRMRALPGLKELAADEAFLSGKAEYVRGIAPELIEPLWAACEPEVVRLEQLTGLDLAAWRPKKPVVAKT